MKIKVTHIGEDYSTVKVGSKEFETSLGLGEAILEEQKTIEIAYYSGMDFPEIGSTIKKDGKSYKVVDNAVKNVTTAILIEDEE